MEHLREKINTDLKRAMRDKKTIELSVLRMLLTALKNKKIEVIGSEDKELNSEQILGVIKTEAKKRKDSIAAYEQGGRDDLAGKEKAELEILKKYLPPEMDNSEIEKVVRQTAREIGANSMKDFGRLMGRIMGKLKNQANGETVSAAVKKALGG